MRTPLTNVRFTGLQQILLRGLVTLRKRRRLDDVGSLNLNFAFFCHFIFVINFQFLTLGLDGNTVRWQRHRLPRRLGQDRPRGDRPRRLGRRTQRLQSVGDLHLRGRILQRRRREEREEGDLGPNGALFVDDFDPLMR